MDYLRAYSKAARETMKSLMFTNEPWSYKDKAYDHEHEVRAVIEFEASTEEGDSLTGGYGDRNELTSRFPTNIHVSIPNGFLEDICIDERCPAYKKAVFKSFLSKYGYALSESQVFSSLFDDEDAT